MLNIAQLSPPAVAFLKQLVGDLVSSEVCSTFMFLPGPFEISFTAGECDGYIPFKMCIGHRDGNNINVYLPLDLSDSTKTTLVVQEINNAEVCFEWIKGAEFDRIVPFRFLDRNGRSDAEHVANMDAFTSVVAYYFLLAGYDGSGVKENWDKKAFITAMKHTQENDAFQAWRSEEVKKKAQLRQAQEEVMAHTIAAAQAALQEIPVNTTPVCNPAFVPIITQDTQREPALHTDRVSAILGLETQRSELDDQHAQLQKQMSHLEGRLSRKQKLDLERRRALDKAEMYKG